MPRATVREAVASFFDPMASNLPSLSKVWRQPPKFANGSDFYSAVVPGSGAGVQMFIHLGKHHDQRVASKRKGVEYPIFLLCYLRSTKQDAESAGDTNDAFLDALGTYLRANHNLSTPSVVFGAGEGGFNGPDDIDIDAALPKQFGNGTVQIFTLVQFTVLEIIDA